MEPLRVRLEGRDQLLEAAVGPARQLSAQLRGWDWRTRIAETPEPLEALLSRAGELEDAIARLERLVKGDQRPSDLLEVASELRSRFEWIRSAGGSGSLAQALEWLLQEATLRGRAVVRRRRLNAALEQREAELREIEHGVTWLAAQAGRCDDRWAVMRTRRELEAKLRAVEQRAGLRVRLSPAGTDPVAYCGAVQWALARVGARIDQACDTRVAPLRLGDDERDELLRDGTVKAREAAVKFALALQEERAPLEALAARVDVESSAEDVRALKHAVRTRLSALGYRGPREVPPLLRGTAWPLTTAPPPSLRELVLELRDLTRRRAG